MNSTELISKLKEVLEELGLSESDFYYGEISKADEDSIAAVVGSYEQLEFGRGATGDHDTYDVVYYFKDHDIYLEANGYYSSWSGADWSDAEFYEVKPVQKTITVYEKVK